ncbi:MAG TPA: hypothetical protein VHH52_05675 [Pseudonocardiaceae bacterium]|jgi:hypothetical protein|nr:hypothetical protein [Pseudonocardiaceae bacterium]
MFRDSLQMRFSGWLTSQSGTFAAASLAFYLALGIILVKFIVAMVGVIVALGSVTFSWAGVALTVEEAGVNTGLIIAAVTALTAVLGAQAQQMVTLHGEGIDASTFPGGRWSHPTTGPYHDGSVKDGTAKLVLRGLIDRRGHPNPLPAAILSGAGLCCGRSRWRYVAGSGGRFGTA